MESESQAKTSARIHWMRAFFVSLFVLLALGACKRNENGQLPAPSGEPIKAQKQEVKGFALASAYPDQHDGDLSIALEFSRPLVGSQNFDALLAVTDDKGAAVKGSWVLDDKGLILRFPYVEAARDYEVLVRADLLAADGSRLGKELKEKFTPDSSTRRSVSPRRAACCRRAKPRFAGRIDQREPKSTSSSCVCAKRTLPRFFAEYQRGGRRGSWELDPSWYDEDDKDSRPPISKLAEPVYVNRFVLGGARNERVLTYLPIQDIAELQQPGLYFAVMKKAGAFKDEFDTAFFSVSDIGLHVRAYKDKLFVHTASLQDGSALANSELRVLDARGEPVFKGKTDGNGNALLDYTLDAAHVLTAARGKDVSMLPFNQPALDLSEFAVSGREQAWFDVFAWSGRDLYRPGETVRVSALLRDNDGKPVLAGSHAASKGKAQSLFVRLRQPDGKTFVESRIEPGAGGYFRFEKTIPVEAPTGKWQVEFRTDPASKEAVQGMALRIEEFLPERMKLDLASADPVLRRGEPFRLRATGAYLYGAPASGNRFTAKLAVMVDRHPLAQAKGWFFGDPTVELPKEARDVVDAALDAEGKLAQDIALPAEVKGNTPVKAIVSGSLYESGGRSVNRSSSACCGRPMRWSACVRCSTTRMAPTPTATPASNWFAWMPTASRRLRRG